MSTCHLPVRYCRPCRVRLEVHPRSLDGEYSPMSGEFSDQVLQYHQMKKETNVLFEGDAYIHYKSNPEISNEKVHNKDIDRIKINPISSVDVVPNVIHRVESISDILLYETSTPHLNDVIRIADDSKRASGRIETEHQSQ